MRRLALPALLPALISCGSAPKRVGERPAVNPARAAAEAAPAAAPANPQIAGGAQLFRAKGCVMCHGDDAKGGVENRYSQAKLIPALDKVADGYTVDELKVKIRKGVPLVARADPKGHVPILIMPTWEDKLEAGEIDQIVAYLMSLAPKGGAKDDGF